MHERMRGSEFEKIVLSPPPIRPKEKRLTPEVTSDGETIIKPRKGRVDIERPRINFESAALTSYFEKNPSEPDLYGKAQRWEHQYRMGELSLAELKRQYRAYEERFLELQNLLYELDPEIPVYSFEEYFRHKETARQKNEENFLKQKKLLESSPEVLRIRAENLKKLENQPLMRQQHEAKKEQDENVDRSPGVIYAGDLTPEETGITTEFDTPQLEPVEHLGNVLEKKFTLSRSNLLFDRLTSFYDNAEEYLHAIQTIRDIKQLRKKTNPHPEQETKQQAA
jgi:hypothetical protein